ncbi:MAG: 50S ribosomal protein L9 [Opitutales bacterium]|nr:50S ribosomal protein L9 [Opitutales bacterium]
MATTEVLLLKHLENLGNEGETVKVRAGYARNFLFPRKLAMVLSKAGEKQIAALQRARAIREEREMNEAHQIADQLSKLAIVIAVKTGENGKMFGAVTPADICAKIAEGGVEIDKKKINGQAIKELGRHVVKIRLHKDIDFELSVEVVSENPIN